MFNRLWPLRIDQIAARFTFAGLEAQTALAQEPVDVILALFVRAFQPVEKTLVRHPGLGLEAVVDDPLVHRAKRLGLLFIDDPPVRIVVREAGRAQQQP